MGTTTCGRRLACNLSGHLRTRRGTEWESLYFNFVEMHKEANVRHPSGCSRAKTMWKVRDVKERDNFFPDQGSEQQIVNRCAVRQELWNKHLENPAQAFG